MSDLSRKKFLQLAFGGSAAALAAAACKKSPSYYVVANKGLVCTDESGLAPADVQARKARGYVDHAADPKQNCGNCVNFRAVSANNCGACAALKGPINPDGHCSSWTKPA